MSWYVHSTLIEHYRDIHISMAISSCDIYVIWLLYVIVKLEIQIISNHEPSIFWDDLGWFSMFIHYCYDLWWSTISPYIPMISPYVPMISPWYPHDIPVVPPFNHSCCLSLSHHFCWLNHHIGGLFIIGFTTCARVKTWYMSIYSL